MTTGRINQVAVFKGNAGQGSRPRHTLSVKTSFPTLSASISQPDNRRLCPPVNVTALRKACWPIARIAKPTPTPYSLLRLRYEPYVNSSAAPPFLTAAERSLAAHAHPPHCAIEEEEVAKGDGRYYSRCTRSLARYYESHSRERAASLFQIHFFSHMIPNRIS